MTPEFNRWWNADELMQKNPYRKDTPIWWAWEGWQARQWAEMSVGLADPQTARPLLSDELGAAMEWKPIETAPKDGTEILAYLITSCESILYMDIISWGRVGIEEDDRWLTCHTEEVYSTPTHWMPLPTPPNV